MRLMVYNFECNKCFNEFELKMSSKEYDKFVEKGGVACPKCTSEKITKIIVGPIGKSVIGACRKGKYNSLEGT